MTSLRKFLFGGRLQQVLAMRAAGRLSAAFCLVRLLPYSRLKRRLEHPPIADVSSRTSVSQSEIVRMVEAVARRVPYSTCLMNAIAAQDMLAAYGHASKIRIGVRMDGEAFAAHAWLEENGEVLIGGTLAPETYKALEIDRPSRNASRGKP